MDEKLILINVRVASIPTFFPHPTDAKKNKLMINVIKNRGKDKATGKSYTEAYSLVFWAGLSDVGACHFPVGRALSVEAVPRNFNKETGITKPNGKPEIISQTTWHVRSFEFGPDSMKELVGRITTNIIALKAAGMIEPSNTVTAEMLLQSNRAKTQPYNAQLAAQTGMHGHARVYIKGTGFIKPLAAVAGAQPVAQEGESIDVLKARLLLMEQKEKDDAATLAAGAAAGTVVDPMAAAK